MKLKGVGKAALAALCCIGVCRCAGLKQKDGGGLGAADYTKTDNWLSLPSGEKDVDVFFLYPTCYFGGSEPWCSVFDSGMRAEAEKIRKAHAGIFDAANFYAPFYRQLGLEYILKLGTADKVFEAIKKTPLVDAEHAFEYFLKHYNKGRPIIFASHSQGSIVMSRLLLRLKEKHPEVFNRTVAAYMIGYPVNQSYCEQVGIPYAEGSGDTAVIISWNTESPAAAEQHVVNPFTALLPDAIAINPINWKRDDTYAGKEESLGSRIRFGDNPPVDRPHFADAQLNLERHVVVTHAAIQAGDPWPAGVLHRYDFDLFYYDFRQNVSDRIAAFKKGP
ncbi:MAG: DUF3089 domain-containing protein [Treponema sp.]|jgi:hypothetical protein|nr:DUF3089 domain-containing protein [Treponema sp.]